MAGIPGKGGIKGRSGPPGNMNAFKHGLAAIQKRRERRRPDRGPAAPAGLSGKAATGTNDSYPDDRWELKIQNSDDGKFWKGFKGPNGVQPLENLVEPMGVEPTTSRVRF